MTLKKRLWAGALALTCSASIVGTAAAEAPPALSSDDARAYSAAFDATERGDFIDAQMETAAVKDRSLLGYLSFHALMHPTAHVAASTSSPLARRSASAGGGPYSAASKRKTGPLPGRAAAADASDGPATQSALSDRARGDGGLYAGDTPRADAGRPRGTAGSVWGL